MTVPGSFRSGRRNLGCGAQLFWATAWRISHSVVSLCNAPERVRSKCSRSEGLSGLGRPGTVALQQIEPCLTPCSAAHFSQDTPSDKRIVLKATATLQTFIVSFMRASMPTSVLRSFPEPSTTRITGDRVCRVLIRLDPASYKRMHCEWRLSGCWFSETR